MNIVKLARKTVSTLCLACLVALNVCALKPNQITIPDDFLVYSESNAASVAQALNIEQKKLEKEIENSGTLLLAVNQNNSKQIRLTVDETDFSAATGSFATLSDTAIKSLLPDITGLGNVQGKIVKDKNGEKLVKIELKNQNEDYLLTQFFTVTDHKIYTLSFYTDSGESTDYIGNTFPTTNASENNTISEKSVSNHTLIQVAVIIATIIFGAIFLFLLFTILRDLIPSKNKEN